MQWELSLREDHSPLCYSDSWRGLAGSEKQDGFTPVFCASSDGADGAVRDCPGLSVCPHDLSSKAATQFHVMVTSKGTTTEAAKPLKT